MRGITLKKRMAFWIVVAAVTFSLGQKVVEKQQRQPSPSADLRMALTIRANQQSYRMGDTVPLEVQLTNTGTSTLYLFDDVCWNPGNFLTIQVFTTEGKEVSGKLDYLRDCLPPPPRRDDISSFIRLEPRTFYGVLEDFSAGELVPSPGDYDIVVYYEAALSAKWIAKYGGSKMAELPVWTRDRPVLTSNHLRVSFRP
jgi:hypothetical protein